MRREVLVVACVVAAVSCRNDMHDQPRYEPLEASAFFKDGMGSRPRLEGTVARGDLREDPRLYTGRVAAGGALVTEIPIPIDVAVLRRGRERFDIYCSPCHDRTGSGRGMVVQRGMKQPPSLHNEALLQKPVGHYFDVMTNGFGAMFPYRSALPVQDRWAIAAYVQVLQRARRASLNDVPEDLRPQLEATGEEATP